MIFAQANAIEHFFESVEFQTLLIVKIYFSKTLFYLPHFSQSMPSLLYLKPPDESKDIFGVDFRLASRMA